LHFAKQFAAQFVTQLWQITQSGRTNLSLRRRSPIDVCVSLAKRLTRDAAPADGMVCW
jgi:hypothetical protein